MFDRSIIAASNRLKRMDHCDVSQLERMARWESLWVVSVSEEEVFAELFDQLLRKW